MNPDDDPEARIRALEQPLSEQARASELGTGQAGSDAAYLPPAASNYSPPDYNTPQYGQYGTQSFGDQPYGTQQWNAPQWGATPPKSLSRGIPWLMFAFIAVVFVVGAAGTIIFMTRMSGVSSTPDDSGFSNDGTISISIPADPIEPSAEVPDVPAIPGVPAAPLEPATDPNVLTGAPGQTVTVSGIDENKSVACNDATVSISGIRNTVNITGHCVSVSVSGVENTITVDAADSIGASGFDNKVIYRTGAPQIDATGSNSVTQG